MEIRAVYLTAVLILAVAMVTESFLMKRRPNKYRYKKQRFRYDDDDDYNETTMGVVPDEQRLYHHLMAGYENSVRPVMNASKTVIIKFGLRLNQIIDLDERHQVLTTNVFIDQEWEDENLKWNASEYNSIKSLRIPAHDVWLPDTFIFNNADDGSTGFMQGVHVLLDENGTVLWPVPVKLKSSCKVDITYFPFDDQVCILRFGSWIYSIYWMDFISTHESADLDLYVDNSEWELLSVSLEKKVERTTTTNSEPRVDLTYTLHIRRRTFYYIFNIIVPCVMLSVLTLLTFWLPSTSGEKVTLGLSVFLAFSMFMLLIAEEVPATSESVPLIGIYLTTVMTMTSVSVILAVIVINVYNKGYKFRQAPGWLRVGVLKYLSFITHMSHDIESLAKLITLPDELEEKKERENVKKDRANGGHRGSQHQVYPLRWEYQKAMENRLSDASDSPWRENNSVNRRYQQRRTESCEPSESDVMETSLMNEPDDENQNFNPEADNSDQNEALTEAPSDESELSEKKIEFMRQKRIIAEWQRIAAVIDRMLFWVYFFGTIFAYVTILCIVPNSKPTTGSEPMTFHASSHGSGATPNKYLSET
ncbi:neuronal acetylcholine receptor subunit alpha-10-like isoform X2 [Lineus longissimus]|uniref:neuronal acetylcholine receptor subunit alpha-10-like isoform X2 n=1 Tax=Lineus longissimus TaxID=88925 RepID=UPI002B4C655F